MPERYEEEIEHILEESKDLAEAPVDLPLDQLSLGEEVHSFYQSVKISKKYSALVALLCLALACFGLFNLANPSRIWSGALARFSKSKVLKQLVIKNSNAREAKRR